jgi:hypothetical protein
MKLICYPTSGSAPKILPAPLERDWMEAIPSGFAYRCLPLNIANAHGWIVLNEAAFVAQWNGTGALDSIRIDAKPTADVPLLGASHFGHGVLTFSINGLFRTEPGYDLVVTGPTNCVKDGIQPLTGIVETDWSPFTFTMNWLFTRKHAPVAFEQGDPICMIFPVPRGLIEQVEPEFRELSSDPEAERAFRDWNESRMKFNADLKVEGSDARARGWQKDYFSGRTESTVKAPGDHRTRIRAKPFKLGGE